MAAPSEAVDLLNAVKKQLTARRQQHLETMSKGLETDRYREYVGRAQECLAVIEVIDGTIRDFIKREEGEDE